MIGKRVFTFVPTKYVKFSVHFTLTAPLSRVSYSSRALWFLAILLAAQVQINSHFSSGGHFSKDKTCFSLHSYCICKGEWRMKQPYCNVDTG